MGAQYLVIDGHSVIFAWADLRRLHDQNRAAARKALADRLQHLHDTTRWRVTLVMDGKLGTAIPMGKRKPTDMVISYATADQTADSIVSECCDNRGVQSEAPLQPARNSSDVAASAIALAISLTTL